jgi:hypothetical protein
MDTAFSAQFSFRALLSGYDLQRGEWEIVYLRGYDGAKYLDDTWTFDGVSSARVMSRLLPLPRATAQMPYDSQTRKVVLFRSYYSRKLATRR